MIFVTVGTERFPFDRLLRSLDEARGAGSITQEIFAQTGTSTYRPKNFQGRAFLGFDEMTAMIEKADIVVSHAGVGSVLLCLSLGKIPVVIPRRHKFGEHLDDHQVAFADKMGMSGRLVAVNDEKDLIEKIIHRDMIVSGLLACEDDSRGQLALYLKNYVMSLSP